MRQAVLTVLLMSFLFTFDPAGSASAQQGCSPAPLADADGAVTLSGDSGLNTLPFDLAGGAYTVQWSGALAGSRPGTLGNVILYLKRTDGPLGSELLANTAVNPQAPTVNGETHVYNVKPGSFYLAVTSPGPWSVTLSPL